MRIAKGKDMKLKQVTFAEALEVMMAGKYAYPTSYGDHPYRVLQNEIQHRYDTEDWHRSGNELQRALGPWFIEVEPMKNSYETTVNSAGTLSYRSLGDGWEYKRVRVIVEEV
jgi:hypothetical protein